MKNRVNISGLSVDKSLYDLVASEVAPGTGIEPDAFWTSLSDIVRDLGPKNQSLLSERDHIQSRIDEWHRQTKNQPIDLAEYKNFLYEIGYVVPEGPDFQIEVIDVDAEISQVAGPQLVVPLDNARYALNAANARWGSLYDAFYGTDVIPDDPGLEKEADDMGSKATKG